MGNFRQRYVQTGSKDHATFSLTPDPGSTEHRAYRLCHYRVSWPHGPITTEHPILSSQRGRISEVTQNKGPKNKQPPTLRELRKVEVESCEVACVVGYIVRRLATDLPRSELRSPSKRSRCRRAVAVDVLMIVLGMYPYDCELDLAYNGW